MVAGEVPPHTEPPVPVDYPRRWEADVALSDGGIVHLRPIVPDDGDRLRRFHQRQSPESIYFRFFSPRPRLSARDVERLTNIDYVDRMAFVALEDDELIGVARYDRYAERSDAEVAFFTDDGHQGRGLATVLLEYLAAAAREVGVSGFAASVLPQNRRMLTVFKQAGFETSSRFADGIIEVELAIDPTPEALAAMEARAARADARSVARLLSPRSIAVVGASRQPHTVGHEVFRQLVARDFAGPVYPVNRAALAVAGVRAYPSVLDIPDEVDLAVVAVPAAEVLGVVEECAHKRARGLVIMSSGFSEAGPEGAELEGRVVAAARRRGMRIIGPNCMGVLNTAPRIRLHATFAGVTPRPGPIGALSQSGTIGGAVLERASQLGLGISTCVAVGNRADVSGNDLLQYWSNDDRTELVMLYLESFGNPRNFARIARSLSRRKPVVAVQSGTARPDHHPAADGSGWPAEATLDAILLQTGVIRVDTLDQLFNVCRLLVNQPLPRGRRVAVLSNAWGPAVLATDACIGAGLELAPLGAATTASLARRLRPEARLANPVELTIDAGPAEYGAALRALLGDDGIDAVLVLYAAPLVGRAHEVAEVLAATAADHPSKPVASTMFGFPSRQPADAPVEVDEDLPVIPQYNFPELAAQALGRVAAYAEWRDQPHGEVPEIDGGEAAAALVSGWLANEPGGRRLDPAEAARLLGTVGIRSPDQEMVGEADSAVGAAEQIGYPVALKATGLDRLAKTEAGGVALDVYGEDEIRAAHRRMAALLGQAMDPALVQEMVAPGVECWVGAHQDPRLGSVITLGPGAVATEDVERLAVRVLPLTDVDAGWLVDTSVVADPVGRAGPEARSALEHLLLRVAALAIAVPELSLIRLNPVVVSAQGAAITDAHIRLSPWPDHSEPAVRRLG